MRRVVQGGVCTTSPESPQEKAYRKIEGTGDGLSKEESAQLALRAPKKRNFMIGDNKSEDMSYQNRLSYIENIQYYFDSG